MTFTSETIFEKLHYVYSRSNKALLTVRKQKYADAPLEEVWKAVCESKSEEMEVIPGVFVNEAGKWLTFERRTDGSVSGCITAMFDPSRFEVWFILTILTNGAICFAPRGPFDASVPEKVTQLFETLIKNSARVDRWAEGRAGFVKSVEFFVSRNIPIEAVLPAFPCKSSNFNKVASCFPDKGEELALLQVIDFVQAVEAVYPPGLKFFIVSDGHVFSDCIHVDDDVVDLYGEKLQELYQKVKPDGFDGIEFRGLNDCFVSDDKHVIAGDLAAVHVDHHVPTQLAEETETNRKILMLGCDDNAQVLREQISTPNHPRLYLYRGFNKFMAEDLAETEIAKLISRKKFKKLTSAVAFEMIRRNDAYSNLVELVFPFHLRLSIHAHHNAGPKYGICLLSRDICAPAGHNKDEEDRLLHIPTPWHNSVFKIENSDKYIVSPSLLSAEIDKQGELVGGWDEAERCFVYTLP